MSKNIEATGKRIGAYDRWRANLESLPHDTYVSLQYAEYSPIRAGAYPYFDIHCFIFPLVLDQSERLTDEQYSEAVSHQSSAYAVHETWLSRLGVPVFFAVIDYGFTTFAVKDISQASSEVSIVNRAKFVGDVIRQTFRNGRDSNEQIKDRNQVSRYSLWHRVILSNNSYLQDVDYVEVRDKNPVAVIEATQVTRGDLKRNFFNFMTRGFTQGMILLQIAERLEVECFCTVYMPDMSRLLVVKLNREVVEMSRPLSPERATLSKQFMRDEKLSYGVAQGKACGVLYDKYSHLIEKMLAATTYEQYTLDQYHRWLRELGR